MYCYVIYHPASFHVAEFYLSVTRRYCFPTSFDNNIYTYYIILYICNDIALKCIKYINDDYRIYIGIIAELGSMYAKNMRTVRDHHCAWPWLQDDVVHEGLKA